MNDNTKRSLMEWAVTQKRVTNGYIRNRFDVDYEEADEMYKFLKQEGIVGTMGSVVKHEL